MRKIIPALLAAISLAACNNSNEPNVENNTTMGNRDSADRGPHDTTITTDSRRNAPGVRDYINDTGNKKQQGNPNNAPFPTKPANQ